MSINDTFENKDRPGLSMSPNHDNFSSSNHRPSLRPYARATLMRSNSLPIPPHSPSFEHDNTSTSFQQHGDPGSPQWRRERLLRIGGQNRTQLSSDSSPIADFNDTTSLTHTRSKTYGSTNFRSLRTRDRAMSNDSVPHSVTPFATLPRLSKRVSFFKRPTVYDAITEDTAAKDGSEAINPNGIRVWYSSFTSIDWLHDAIKDSRRRFKLRRRKSLRGRVRNIIDRSIGWIVVTIIGILSAILAFLIVRSEQWLFDLKEGRCKGAWHKAKSICCPQSDDLFITLSETEAICDSWQTWSDLAKAHGIDNKSIEFISYTIIAAAGSGIPEVKTILSGFVIHGYLGGRTLVVKATGLALSVASGKEGPLVHIAACLGNIVEGKRREILSAASAAGVAVAFGAPVGGVLFSLEEVSYFFPAKVMLRSLFCAIVGALTLRILDPFGTGKIVLFQVRYDKGVYGAYFSSMNYWWTKNVRGKTWLGSYPVSEVLLITFITTMLCFINPYTRMAGTELVYNLFEECHKGESHKGLCPKTPDDIRPLILAIGIAMIVKAMLTVVTFGIKLPAGIFIPTLGVGACFGRIVGYLVQYLQWKRPDMPLFKHCVGDNSCIVPGIYAMVGAAAALSGVTRTTVSLAVIMCELTDTLTYVVPIVVGILISKTVADALQPKGIYDLCIELAQLPYLDNKLEYYWDDLQAADIAIRDVEVIYIDEVNTVTSLRDKLQAAMRNGNSDSGFPILQKSSQGAKTLGYVGVSELEHALGDSNFSYTFPLIFNVFEPAIVAESADAECYFNPARSQWNHPYIDDGSSIMSSGEFLAPDAFDFTKYIDQAPLSVPSCASLELVQQFFVKLGARYRLANGR
ncbi:hypothetical protein Clacol_000472 [Clathrus columnatus]|uniref:Chloride channel protein n=1 Tax=Clathrus columnatus TaxID=1419009 RepID=A0AAV4ZZT2_9AGAM|nr:hypothetical protein Clacol_000472 [Clathrus columnatus]